MGFQSWQAYRKIAHEVRTRNRFVLSDESKAFLEEVAKSAKDHAYILQVGTVLWRAQLGYDWREHEQDGVIMGEIECPNPESRMFPLRDRASEGRVNPRGIPCFYAASDRTTALSEVRPWVGAKVSIGCFCTLKELNIVDCSAAPDHLPFYFNISETGRFKEPEQPKIDEMVWGWLNHAFSKPTDNDDKIAEYAPTQMTAEILKNAGYDGIRYRSKLGSGLNIALFDVDAVEIKSCEIHEVKSVAITHAECGNGWIKENGAAPDQMTFFNVSRIGPLAKTSDSEKMDT